MEAKKAIFNKILVMSRKTDPVLQNTLSTIIKQLQANSDTVWVEAQTASTFGVTEAKSLAAADATDIDLLVVIGGDGSILQATPIAIAAKCPILGINSGRLGFLSDLNPSQLDQLDTILSGTYEEESRLVLSMTHHDEGQTRQAMALNEVVLLPGQMTRMIEFTIEVNQQFVCNQHADGLIVTTPTGSTAHALSAGGPIIHPGSDVIAMVPLCPHRLSSRPIVIHANSEICITIGPGNHHTPLVSCDGGEGFNAAHGSSIHIKAAKESLRLIHPKGHDHFRTLREKLHWEH